MQARVQSQDQHPLLEKLLDTLKRTGHINTHVDHHQSFLRNCLENKIHPKGLTIELAHQAKAPTQTLLDRWNETLTQTSLKLTELYHHGVQH